MHYYGDRKIVKEKIVKDRATKVNKVDKIKVERKKREPKPKYTCLYCGRIQTIGSFCSDRCKEKFDRLEDTYKNRILGIVKIKKKRLRNNKIIRWSKEVRKRANNVCELCGEPAVDAHHIVPICVDKELIYDLDNGIALCLECHRKKHPELPEALFKKRLKYE